MLHLKQGHLLTVKTQQPAQMQLFQLTPLVGNANIGPVSVDLSPVNGISQLPTINGDSKFLPFLFISPIEKARLESNEQNGENSTCNFLTEAFRAKLSAAQEEPEQYRKVILKARPHSSYCQICRENFTDYEEHVKHQIHRKKVTQNEYSRHIERLVQNFQINEQRGFKRIRPCYQKKKDSDDAIQQRSKKIVLGKSEFGTVSVTKIHSEVKENSHL